MADLFGPSDVVVTDDNGHQHIFPPGTTPDQIAKTLGLQLAAPAGAIGPAPKTGSAAWWKEKAWQGADVATQTLPAAGAIFGSWAGALGGPPGMVAGAALGGGGGEATRQYIRQWLGLDKPSTFGQTAKDVAYQGALAGTLDAGGQAAGPIIGAGVNKLARSLNVATPAEQQAVQFGLQRGIPVDPATATGSKYIRGAQWAAERTSPFAAGVGEQAAKQQAQGLARVGGELAEQAYPAAAQVPESAGQAVRDELSGKISTLKKQADTYYDTYRRYVNDPSAVRSVQQGVDADGNPIMEDIATPVDMRTIKAQLQPIYKNMSQWIEPARRQASAGYQAMDSIINGPDFVPADIAEKGLGGLKSMAREAASPDMRNVSQGIAARAVGQLQGDIDSAVSQYGGQDALTALQKGRALVAQKMGTADVLDTISQEPVKAFRNLTLAGDAGIDKLRTVAGEVPGVMPKIGRAYLEDLMTTATAEGGFSRAQGLMQNWQKLGPETKKLLFPNPMMRQDLDNFFLLAKRIQENPNPSGTALLESTVTPLTLLFVNPISGAKTMIGGYALAKLLRSPGTADLLLKGMSQGAMTQLSDRLAYSALLTNLTKRAIDTGAADVYTGSHAQDIYNKQVPQGQGTLVWPPREQQSGPAGVPPGQGQQPGAFDWSKFPVHQ